MIQKRLDNRNVLIKNRLYPTRQKPKGKHKALLGIGGNISDVIRRFDRLYIYLSKSPLINIIESSPILKNPPFGYISQDDFHNALLLVETTLSPKELLRYVLSVEDRFGRRRSFANAPRTLDIDIIFYEDRVIKTKDLIVPHHDWKGRDSVVLPMSFMREYI